MRRQIKSWKSWVAMLAGCSVMGCGSSATNTGENETSSTSEAIQATSGSSNAVEAADLFHGPQGFHFKAAEGFRCDDSPEITYADVCGKKLPATVHLEWTDCDAPHFSRGPGGGPRPPPPHGRHGGDGGRPEEMFASDAGTPRPSRDDHPGHGPSSGTVDITHTYTTPDDCSGDIVQNQEVTFAIERTDDDNSVARVSGSTSSVAQLLAKGPPRLKESEVDVTRTLKDDTGTLIRSVHIVGSKSVTFTEDSPPTRTTNASYQETHLDGTSGSVTEKDVVSPPMDVCPWPTSGTLTQIRPDGTTHVLTYGPDCGDATLDGEAIEMPRRQPGPRGHR